MLVLSRKVGQRILIGDQIVVTIVRVGQGGVRVGIEAPRELAVVREELAAASDPTANEPTAKEDSQRSQPSVQRIVGQSSGANSSPQQPLAKPPATIAGNNNASSTVRESDGSAETPRVLPR